MAPRIARLRGTSNTLTLHHSGRRNGTLRTTELPYLEDGENVVVAAARRGSDLNPSWFHNITAAPEAAVTIGRTQRNVLAREALGDERDALWTRLIEAIDQLAEFQARTARRIPVIVLEPRA